MGQALCIVCSAENNAVLLELCKGHIAPATEQNVQEGKQMADDRIIKPLSPNICYGCKKPYYMPTSKSHCLMHFARVQ